MFGCIDKHEGKSVNGDSVEEDAECGTNRHRESANRARQELQRAMARPTI